MEASLSLVASKTIDLDHNHYPVAGKEIPLCVHTQLQAVSFSPYPHSTPW
jgi:hypothetical protein